MNPSRPVAGSLVLLDANVLYPISICDFILTASSHQLLARPTVSAEILDEATRNITADRPDLEPARRLWAVVASCGAASSAVSHGDGRGVRDDMGTSGGVGVGVVPAEQPPRVRTRVCSMRPWTTLRRAGDPESFAQARLIARLTASRARLIARRRPRGR